MRLEAEVEISEPTTPVAVRLERNGHRLGAITKLVEAMRDVVGGATVLEAIADGTLLGWYAREALMAVCDGNLLDWDGSPYRVQEERILLVEKTLGFLGYAAPRRGGWSVTP